MKYDIDEGFVVKHPKRIANVSDVLVPPNIYRIIPKYAKKIYYNHAEEWVSLWGYHSDPYISDEEEFYRDLRILMNLVDVHPELVGLLKVGDGSGEMVDYIPEKLFKFDEKFIKDHLTELIECEDYVPIDFNKYPPQDLVEEFDTAQDERELFIGWENNDMIQTYKEMNDLILQKCIAYEDRIKAFNSVVIEWLDCHPEFEGIIANESFQDYQNMKNNKEFISFNDLLDFVKLPSESNDDQINLPKNPYTKDDSSIRLPNFKAIDKIFNKYGASLLSCYLSYLV